MKILFVDLDGTIRRPLVNPNGFISSPTDQELIPGVLPVLQQYQEDEWEIVGISNQGGVVAGHKSLEQCKEEMIYTLKLCYGHVSAILFCPDYEGDQCIKIGWAGYEYSYSAKNFYRKPQPGMLLEVLADLAAYSADCLMIGDRTEDEQCAKNAGVPFQHRDQFFGVAV